MLRALRSAAAMHMASSVLQRGSALGLTIVIGQSHSLERMGEWIIGQSLALAIQGPVGLALAQHLIADSSAPGASRRREFLEATKLAIVAIALAFGVAYLVFVAGVLPADWLVLGPVALASLWLYATGGAVHLLVSAWLFAEGDGLRLRRLVAVGCAALALPLPLVNGLHLWAGVAAAGLLLGGGALLTAALSGADLQVAWRARTGRVFARALPLALGNAMVNPAVFVAMYAVGALGGAPAAAVYGIGNQIRNLWMLPASLVLPLHLRARAAGGRSRVASITLCCVTLASLPCMVRPDLAFGLFSAQPSTSESDWVVRLALASVPLALMAAFAGQTLVAMGQRWSSPLLNGVWCTGLLLAFLALSMIDAAATRMSAAQVLAYAALLSVVAALLRRGAAR